MVRSVKGKEEEEEIQMTPETSCYVGITGNLETMTLETAIRLIHEAGCAYTTEFGEKTTCLVVGTSPDARIMAKAAELKTFVVWENQFLERLGSARCRGG
jgi:NAD-dependent DNA ligase